VELWPVLRVKQMEIGKTVASTHEDEDQDENE
jgi:hypothetical protein